MSNDTQTIDSGPAAGMPTKAFIQHAADAPTASLGASNTTRFMLSGIAGQPDFYEYRAVRGDSPPLHRHPWATLEFIIEGSIRYQVDGEEFTAGAGDFVYTPPSAVHTFLVESETARMVGFNHPNPRFAELQERAVPLFAGSDGPNMPALMELTAELGVELMGPPMQLPQ